MSEWAEGGSWWVWEVESLLEPESVSMSGSLQEWRWVVPSEWGQVTSEWPYVWGPVGQGCALVVASRFGSP